MFVPYKGAAPALTDVLAGQIQMHSTAKSVLLPHIQAGKLRALAVEGDKRWPELPDVPTLQEVGFGGFPPAIWYGFLAPAKRDTVSPPVYEPSQSMVSIWIPPHSPSFCCG